MNRLSLFLILFVSSISFAECQRESIFTSNYDMIIKSAVFDPSTNDVTVKVDYNFVKQTSAPSSLCTPLAGRTSSTHTVSIGLSSTSTTIIDSTSLSTTGTRTFIVSLNGLDLALVKSGIYMVSASATQTGRVTNTYYTYNPGYAYSNIITGWPATYSYSASETQTLSCPVTQPNGSILQTRTYDVWSDGSKKNYSSWVTTSNSCSAVYQSTESQSQTLACSTPYAEGGNGITQTRTRQIWSDGIRNWSNWATVSNICYRTKAESKDNIRKICAEGQTGYKVTELRRIYKEYSVDSSKTPAEQAVINEQNASEWELVLVADYCVNLPNKVIISPATRILSCETIYGGLKNNYTGEVIESGNNIISYNNVTHLTTTAFQSNTPPTYSSTCKTTVSDLTMETKKEMCSSGYIGEAIYYRYKGINSDGTSFYQNPEWSLLQNDCTPNTVDNSSNGINNLSSKSKGLLSNITIKTSVLNNKEFENFVKNVNPNELYDGNYKLNIVIEDLSAGVYNINNVSNAVHEFQKATGNSSGNNINIVFPNFIENYIGYGGITQYNIKNIVLKNVELENNKAVITYQNIDKGLKKSSDQKFSIDVFNSNVLAQNITQKK